MLVRPIAFFTSLSWKLVANALDSGRIAPFAVLSAEQLHAR